jgi:hypothetical protein
MIVFSRSFIRKRVISLATTASVAATSLALVTGRPKRITSAAPCRSNTSRMGQTIPTNNHSYRKRTPP